MTLAPFVRIVAQGKGRARALTLEEAEKAMTCILSGAGEPEAVGALLMVLRLRGETDAEIAGFTKALRAFAPPLKRANLDWPSYSAGRTRGAPLFILAAKLVANAGYSVAVHGYNSHQSTAADLRKFLQNTGICCDGLDYHPLETLCPAALDLLKLRDTFGLRSCFNTVLRMWNPTGAGTSVQGVFHPSYRGLQSRAARLLGDQNLSVIKGGGGEFERNPSKDVSIFGLREGQELNEKAPAMLGEVRRLHQPEHPTDLQRLWNTNHDDQFAVATVVGTAALALWTLRAAPTQDAAIQMANALWQARHETSRKSA